MSENRILTLDEIRECLKNAPEMPIIENPMFIDEGTPELNEFRDRIANGGDFTEEELSFMRHQAEMAAEFIIEDERRRAVEAVELTGDFINGKRSY